MGEPGDVGVVDQLGVGDHRPTITVSVALDHVLDRVEGLAHRGIADRMNVDLKSEIVHPTGGLSQRVALPVPHTVAVQTGAIRRQQSAGLVLHHPVSEELDGLRGEQRRARLGHPGPGLGELLHLGVEVPRIGVEGEVEPHPQGIGLGGRQVGGDVGGFHPGVLHPGDAAGQKVVGRRAQGGDPYVLAAGRHHVHHQVDRAPFAQGAEH